MRYQVPQFIEVEDKIFGPFTFKQFIYLIGGAGACYLSFRVFGLILGLPFMIFFGGSGLALAFYKINNRPLIQILDAAFKYIIASRLYVWKRVDKLPEKSKAEDLLKAHAKSILDVPKLSNSRLKDLAWSLDINETAYSHEAKKHSEDFRY